METIITLSISVSRRRNFIHDDRKHFFSHELVFCSADFFPVDQICRQRYFQSSHMLFPW
jgi:hypothetical protein